MDYLEHHGVLGMKWGIRNAETQRRYASESYGRAVKKAAKLDKKAVKRERKAKKLMAKTTRFSLINSESGAKKLRSAIRKDIKATKKAKRWANKMNKKFSDTNLSDVDPATREAGKAFVTKYASMKNINKYAS